MVVLFLCTGFFLEWVVDWGSPPRHCVAPLYVIEQILSPTNSSLLKFVPFLPQVFGKPRGELYQVYDR